jgi:hypothetical protein
VRAIYPPDLRSGLGFAPFEVELEVVAAIAPILPLQHREPEVRSIPVDLPDGGTEVMQVGFYPSELRV